MRRKVDVGIKRMFAMAGVSVPVPDAIDAFLGLGTAPAPTKKKKKRIDKPDRKLEKQKAEKPRLSLRRLRER